MYACLHAEGNAALLVDCARYFSPLFEISSADSVLIDLRGLRSLFGSPHAIADAMMLRAGVPVALAIAGDPDTASFAARGFPGTTVIAPGNEQIRLAPLPLNFLGGSSETAATLSSWGIRTFGEFAQLPSKGVAARLGREGVQLQRLARGQGCRQLRPVEETVRFEELVELEAPVELLESLLFLLSRSLHDLCRRLGEQFLATDELRLVLALENAPPHLCTLRLPVPMRDPKVLLKLLQLELEGRPPAAAIAAITLELKPAEVRTEQHNLFVAQTPEAEKLEITLSKLANLLGAQNVGRPELIDTHRPDAYYMRHFTGARVTPGMPLPSKPALMLRRFRPPRHVQVVVKEKRPEYLRSMQCRVIACLGPWQSSGDWWMADSWDYAEWDIGMSDGAVYRLREHRRTTSWFLEGVYD